MVRVWYDQDTNQLVEEVTFPGYKRVQRVDIAVFDMIEDPNFWACSKEVI